MGIQLSFDQIDTPPEHFQCRICDTLMDTVKKGLRCSRCGFTRRLKNEEVGKEGKKGF